MGTSIEDRDRLFAALDGYGIDGADRSWIVRVEAIHTIDDRHWVQVLVVRIAGNVRVLLNVSREVTPQRMQAALRNWLERSDPEAAPLLSIDPIDTVDSLGSPHHSAPDSVRRARRVLIVDDNQGTVDSFARMLQLEGYTVDTALDGRAGLRLAEGTPFDAILLDWNMPTLDGLSLLKHLRVGRSNQHTPVAIVTGDYTISSGTVAELTELGATLRFKPLWLEELTALTHTLLDAA
jgi:CheY-like chemotaxis protein